MFRSLLCSLIATTLVCTPFLSAAAHGSTTNLSDRILPNEAYDAAANRYFHRLIKSEPDTRVWAVTFPQVSLLSKANRRIIIDLLVQLFTLITDSTLDSRQASLREFIDCHLYANLEHAGHFDHIKTTYAKVKASAKRYHDKEYEKSLREGRPLYFHFVGPVEEYLVSFSHEVRELFALAMPAIELDGGTPQHTHALNISFTLIQKIIFVAEFGDRRGMFDIPHDESATSPTLALASSGVPAHSQAKADDVPEKEAAASRATTTTSRSTCISSRPGAAAMATSLAQFVASDPAAVSLPRALAPAAGAGDAGKPPRSPARTSTQAQTALHYMTYSRPGCGPMLLPEGERSTAVTTGPSLPRA